MDKNEKKMDLKRAAHEADAAKKKGQSKLLEVRGGKAASGAVAAQVCVCGGGSARLARPPGAPNAAAWRRGLSLDRIHVEITNQHECLSICLLSAL